jgi:hypothetical protein
VEALRQGTHRDQPECLLECWDRCQCPYTSAGLSRTRVADGVQILIYLNLRAAVGQAVRFLDAVAPATDRKLLMALD